MTRLIISIVLFIILAVFIALNAGYSTQINLFGYFIESVSVAAVVTITLAAGVIYSFLLYLTNYFTKQRSERLKTQKNRNKQKAEELEVKAKELEQKAAPHVEDVDAKVADAKKTNRKLFGKRIKKKAP